MEVGDLGKKNYGKNLILEKKNIQLLYGDYYKKE
jgi:hypothetical protein